MPFLELLGRILVGIFTTRHLQIMLRKGCGLAPRIARIPLVSHLLRKILMLRAGLTTDITR
jgi:hypothetical protein